MGLRPGIACIGHFQGNRLLLRRRELEGSVFLGALFFKDMVPNCPSAYPENGCDAARRRVVSLEPSKALVIPLGIDRGGCKFALAALSVLIAASKRQSKRKLGFHATDSQYRHHRTRRPRQNH